MKLGVVLPAYNEEKSLEKVITTIPKKIRGIKETIIVVVDDNSRDRTSDIALNAGAHLVRHRMNLGQGAAIITGIAFCKRFDVDLVVALDTDGQHDPKEIAILVDQYRKNHQEMIIGSRFLSDTIKEMPAIKFIGNRAFNIITYALSGQWVTDSQSGFRLFSREMIELMLNLDLAGYEFCSETIMIARKNGFKIGEAPITTIYDPKRTSGQNPINGINILVRLLYRKILG